MVRRRVVYENRIVDSRLGDHRSHGRYEEVKLPIIGVGRTATVEDAIQFLLAGAHAVQVGTAICRDPRILIQIISGLQDYLLGEDIKSVNQLVGWRHKDKHTVGA